MLKENGESQISLTDPDSRAMVNNQRIEVCYTVQTTMDEKHKLILDHEVTNEVKDSNLLSTMSRRAKEILEVDELDVSVDKAYYDAVEIKECVDTGIIPYIPEPDSTVSKKINVPEPPFYKREFKYDGEKDVYICPAGFELALRNRAEHHRKMMKLYKTDRCAECQFKPKCTRYPRGRIIYRWEHEGILEEMRKRVAEKKEKMKKPQWLSEHPFGTIKRAFNQGYMLMRGIEKVGAEISLSVLAYNMRRAINVVGLKRLIAVV